MSAMQPIRKKDEICKLRKFFYDKGELRNYTLVTLGINTALRISDLLQIRWKDVWSFEQGSFKEHMIVTEQKTKKIATIYLNDQCVESLCILKESLQGGIAPEEYIFKSRVGVNNHIGRNRAYMIIREACHSLGYEGHLGCHSLRKTFGYHAWKQGVSPALIMSIYNHSSMDITKRYLSIEQDDKDEVYKNIVF